MIYQDIQDNLDRAHRAAVYEQRENRPHWKGVFAGHARRWLREADRIIAAVDEQTASMFADERDELSDIIAAL